MKHPLITAAAFLLLIAAYYVGEAMGLLVFAMFVILPLGYWVIEKIFGSNS